MLQDAERFQGALKDFKRLKMRPEAGYWRRLTTAFAKRAAFTR